MAAPRWDRNTVRYVLPQAPRPVERPGRPPDGSPKRSPGRSRKEVLRRRKVMVLILLPVMLMLGSVYLHTVAADFGDRAATLQERADNAQAEQERLDIEVAKLSAPGRIRPLASGELQMREPASNDLKVYGKDGEDEAQKPERGVAEGSE